MSTVLQAYEQGLKNAEFHIANADSLQKEANSSLTVILAAGLGALGYSARLIEQNAPLELIGAVGAVSVHLLMVAGLLVRRCLSAGDIMPPANEPSNLAHQNFTWEEVITVEIPNLDVRISFNQARNKIVGRWLNGLRYAAFSSPLTFLLVWAVGRWVWE